MLSSSSLGAMCLWILFLLGVTNDQVRQAFSQFGELVHVNILRGKRCGFVQFGDRACTEQVLSALNGTPIDGQNVRLSWGHTPLNKQIIDELVGVCFINMTIFPWEELRKQTGATASVECSSKSQQDALKQLWRLAYKGSSSSQINVLLSARLQFGKEVSKDISNRMEKELDTFHVPDSSFARLNDDKNSVIERDGKNGSSRYADGNDAGS